MSFEDDLANIQTETGGGSTTTQDDPRIYNEGLFTRDVVISGPPIMVGGRPQARTTSTATLSKEVAAFRTALINGNPLAANLVTALMATKRLPKNHNTEDAVRAYSSLLRSTLESRTNPETGKYDPGVGMSAPQMLEVDLSYMSTLEPSGGAGRGPRRVVTERGVTPQQAAQMARQAYRSQFGINPDQQQIRSYVSALMKAVEKNPVITTYNADGSFQRTVGGLDMDAWQRGYMAAQIPGMAAQGEDLGGAAGVTQDVITRLEEDYGVKLTDKLRMSLLRQLQSGAIDQAAALETVKDVAKSQYAGLAGDIDRGITVRAKADPFIRSMAQIWEMPESEINIDTPEIRNALSMSDDKGNVRMATQAEFEETLRKNPRWLETTTARQSAVDLTNSLLKTMGFVG